MSRPALRATITTVAIALAALAASGSASAASPAATTAGVASVTQTQATLRADVDPQGLATTYAFQYGTNTGYGAQTTPRSAGDGTVARRVTFQLTGLTPGVELSLPRHRHERGRHDDGRRPRLHDETAAGQTAHRARHRAIRAERRRRHLHGRPERQRSADHLPLPVRHLDRVRARVVRQLDPGRRVARPVEFRINSLASRKLYHFRVVASNRAGTTYGPDTIAQTGPFPLDRLEAAARPGRSDALSSVVRDARPARCSAPACRSRRVRRRPRSPCASPRATGRSRARAGSSPATAATGCACGRCPPQDVRRRGCASTSRSRATRS